MVLGLLTFELHIPHARSLKEKRRVVRAVVDRVHRRYRASVIESDHHDLHQRAAIAVALLAQNETEILTMFQNLRSTVELSEARIALWDERILQEAP